MRRTSTKCKGRTGKNSRILDFRASRSRLHRINYPPLVSPGRFPAWEMWGAFGCQALSLGLTAILWGRWQAKLARDPLGPASPHLARILKTHWVRTALSTLSAAVLFDWVLRMI